MLNSLTTASEPDRKASKHRKDRQQEYSRWLTDVRLRARLTQKQLALATGMANSQISRYERGVNLPSRETVLHLAKVLDADPAEALQVAGYELEYSTPKSSHPRRSSFQVAAEPKGGLETSYKNVDPSANFAESRYQTVYPSAPVQIAVANDLATRADIRRTQLSLEERFSEMQEMLFQIVKILKTSEEYKDVSSLLPDEHSVNSRLRVLSRIASLSEFQEDLNRAFEDAYRRNASLSLMLIDVDNLKAYNQQCGHHLGDKVLRVVADLLGRIARPTDTIARLLEERGFDWGNRYGDQFALLMPGANAEQAHQMAEQYRNHIDTYPWECKKITASISVVTRTGKMITGGDLLQRAADELDAQRENGRREFTAS